MIISKGCLFYLWPVWNISFPHKALCPLPPGHLFRLDGTGVHRPVVRRRHIWTSSNYEALVGPCPWGPMLFMHIKCVVVNFVVSSACVKMSLYSPGKERDYGLRKWLGWEDFPSIFWRWTFLVLVIFFWIWVKRAEITGPGGLFGLSILTSGQEKRRNRAGK